MTAPKGLALYIGVIVGLVVIAGFTEGWVAYLALLWVLVVAVYVISVVFKNRWPQATTGERTKMLFGIRSNNTR